MTRRRLALLSESFFTRLFENEVFSSSVSASSATTWLLAIVATPGVMISASQLYFFAHARTFAPEKLERILVISQTLHVAFAMSVAGLLTMLVWTALSPDRRDALVLGPLPVATRELAVAKLIALGRFFVTFAVAVSVPAAVVFTFVTVGDDMPIGQVVARITGHTVATFGGAAFVFFGLLCTQVLVAATLGPHTVAIAAVPLQVAALLAMVATVVLTPRLADALVTEAPTSTILLNPTAWFVGVYRWIAGHSEPVYGTLAVRAAVATVATVGVTLSLHPAAYARCQLNAMLGRAAPTGQWSPGWLSRALLHLVARSPLERGLTQFVVSSIVRSHGHRFLIGGYAAIGLMFALPVVGRLIGVADTHAERYAWFAVPLGMLWWCAAGVRVAMMLPVEPRANWVFRLTEPVDKWALVSTSTRIVSVLTVVPIGLTAAASASVTSGVAFGAVVGAVVVSAGLLLTEGLTFSMHTVPCTGTYRPGQLRLRVLWPAYALVWIGMSNLLPRVAAGASTDLSHSIGLVFLLLLVTAALRIVRRLHVRQRGDLVYDAPEPTTATTLALVR